MSEPEEAEVAAWLGARSERMIETSCARVFLQGDAALKVKRRVNYGYLDFSTLEKRLWATERELAFNRAAAPQIYRAVRRLTRAPDGGLEWEGAGALVEPVLEMARFDQDAVLSAHPERIDGALAEALGRTVARSHAAAPVRADGGGAAALRYTIDSNAEQLRGLGKQLGTQDVEELIAGVDRTFTGLADLLEQRRAQGFSRHCHADLHLANIVLLKGRPVLFDCIEFNDRLSEIDVLYDLAFLLMDLDFRGRREAGARVLSAYLDEAARSFPATVWDGLALLPLMLSVRASVRAHVSVHGGEAGLGPAYLKAALRHLQVAPAELVAVGGLSGSGKSSFARRIAPELGAAPGAVVLRTDEVRKRLAGVGPTETLPASAYGPAFYDRVYSVMFGEAGRALAAGRSVVLDATFVQPALRARAAEVAQAAGVAFRGVWLEAPVEVLAERIGRRAADASDATLETLRMQSGLDLGQIGWARVDASGAADAVARRWLEGPASAAPGDRQAG